MLYKYILIWYGLVRSTQCLGTLLLFRLQRFSTQKWNTGNYFQVPNCDLSTQMWVALDTHISTLSSSLIIIRLVILVGCVDAAFSLIFSSGIRWWTQQGSSSPWCNLCGYSCQPVPCISSEIIYKCQFTWQTCRPKDELCLACDTVPVFLNLVKAFGIVCWKHVTLFLLCRSHESAEKKTFGDKISFSKLSNIHLAVDFTPPIFLFFF